MGMHSSWEAGERSSGAGALPVGRAALRGAPGRAQAGRTAHCGALHHRAQGRT